MHLASFFMLALLCTLTMAAPQQNRPEDDQTEQEVEEEKPVEKSSQKPVDLPKPSTESSKQVDLPKIRACLGSFSTSRRLISILIRIKSSCSFK